MIALLWLAASMTFGYWRDLARFPQVTISVPSSGQRLGLRWGLYDVLVIGIYGSAALVAYKLAANAFG